VLTAQSVQAVHLLISGLEIRSSCRSRSPSVLPVQGQRGLLARLTEAGRDVCAGSARNRKTWPPVADTQVTLGVRPSPPASRRCAGWRRRNLGTAARRSASPRVTASRITSRPRRTPLNRHMAAAGLVVLVAFTEDRALRRCRPGHRAVFTGARRRAQRVRAQRRTRPARCGVDGPGVVPDVVRNTVEQRCQSGLKGSAG
jgi:hypothetical protein